MKKEDLENVLQALEFGLNECPVKDYDYETHFNTFANAIELVKDELVKKSPVEEIKLLCPFCNSEQCQIIEAVSECYCDDCEKEFTA